MAAIYSNGGNRWNILGFNFTKRDALSSVYKISMGTPCIVAPPPERIVICIVAPPRSERILFSYLQVIDTVHSSEKLSYDYACS
jgi:hypothetical protein